jgi:hypothetical protein
VVAGATAWANVQNKYYSDLGTPPTGWGSTSAKIDSNTFPQNFTFTLNLESATNPGAVVFSGLASGVQYDSSWSNPKTNVDIPFQITLTGTSAAPEPGTTALLGLGAAFLLAGGIRKNTKKKAAR